MLTWIAMNKPIDSYLNSCARNAVCEIVNSVQVDQGHLYAHRSSVSYRIQLSSWAWRIPTQAAVGVRNRPLRSGVSAKAGRLRRSRSNWRSR